MPIRRAYAASEANGVPLGRRSRANAASASSGLTRTVAEQPLQSVLSVCDMETPYWMASTTTDMAGSVTARVPSDRVKSEKGLGETLSGW